MLTEDTRKESVELKWSYWVVRSPKNLLSITGQYYLTVLTKLLARYVKKILPVNELCTYYRSIIEMRLLLILFLATVHGSTARDCSKLKKPSSKLFCYYSKLTDYEECYCTHIVLPPNSDVKTVDKARQLFKNSQILVTVNQFNMVSSKRSNIIQYLQFCYSLYI